LFVFNNIPALVVVFIIFLSGEACRKTFSLKICDKFAAFVMGG